MGLGLLGAMGGVGESVSSIGKQMYQGALDQEKMDYLTEKQKAMELFKQKLINDERSKVSDIIKASTNRSVDGEGPPTEDGQMPQRPMSRREQISAAGNGLLASGRVDDANKLLSLAEKGDTAQDRYYNQLIMERERAAAADLRNQRTNDTRMYGHNLRAETAERGQDMRFGGGNGSGGSRSSKRGYGSSDSMDLGDYVEAYSHNFKVVGPNSDKEVTDSIGQNAFRSFMSEAIDKGYSNKQLEQIAGKLVRQISAARSKANGNDSVYWSLLNDEPGKQSDSALIEDINKMGRADLEAELTKQNPARLVPKNTEASPVIEKVSNTPYERAKAKLKPGHTLGILDLLKEAY